MLDGCVKVYLDSLAGSTADNRQQILDRFFGFCGVSPSEAVDWQKEHPYDYRFVDFAYKWLSSEKHLMVGTKNTYFGTINGFFITNRAPLPKDNRRHRFHSEKVPVIGDLKVEELRKIVVASTKPDYAAAFMFQFQSGDGVGELCYSNIHHADHVWDEVRRGRRIIRLDMPGRKANRNVRPYYTFIGPDTVDLLKRLFHSRGWKRDTVLFRTTKGDPVSPGSLQSYFRHKAMQLGFIKAKTPPCMDCGGETVKRRHNPKEGSDRVFYLCSRCGREKLASQYKISQHEYCGIRYRMRTHELRDVFSTEWGRAQAYFGVVDFAGEFFMGHGIDPLKYKKIMEDKSFGLDQYRRASPMLNILSENPRVIDRSEIDVELESYRTENKDLRRDLKQVRQRLETLEDQVEKRLDEIDKKTKQWTKSLE